ncbi:hypothetical protein KKH26_01415 [Patescibacteria group bacterium]|nr:hypothetical protein [Patescibacteria group bacterium]
MVRLAETPKKIKGYFAPLMLNYFSSDKSSGFTNQGMFPGLEIPVALRVSITSSRQLLVISGLVWVSNPLNSSSV